MQGTSKDKGGLDGTPRMKAPTEVQIQVDEDGFQLVSTRRKGKPTYTLHQSQGGAHKANYLETLLKGSNVATVSFGKGSRGDRSGRKLDQPQLVRSMEILVLRCGGGHLSNCNRVR